MKPPISDKELIEMLASSLAAVLPYAEEEAANLEELADEHDEYARESKRANAALRRARTALRATKNKSAK